MSKGERRRAKDGNGPNICGGTGRHAFNPKALKALGVDPALARELGYPLKDSEDPESNLAA